MFYLSVQIPRKSRSESFSLLFKETYTSLTFTSEKVSNNQVVKIAGLGHFSYRCMKTFYRYEVMDSREEQWRRFRRCLSKQGATGY